MEKDNLSTNPKSITVSDVDLSEFDPLKTVKNSVSNSNNVSYGFDDNFSSACAPKPPPRVKRPAPPPPPVVSNKSENQLSLKGNQIDVIKPKQVQEVLQAKRHNSLVNDQTNFDYYSDDMNELVENLSMMSKKSASMTTNSSKIDKTYSNERAYGKSSFYTKNEEYSSNHSLGTREEILNQFMNRREDEYIEKENLNVFVGSWNVNGKSPSEDLDDWLLDHDVLPELYFIGFQELDLSKEAFVFTDSVKEQEWIKKVSFTLQFNYRLVKHVRLVGMMLLFYCKKKVFTNIKNISTRYIGTGLLGKMGNKGGVGVRFDYKNSTICVVNSHLAAHTENIKRRNQDFEDIKSRMKFNNDASLECNIFDHDILVWLGDLNYRIEGLDVNTIKQLCKQKEFRKLIDFDQLSNERLKKQVFNNFTEGNINFIPTYKYDPGTNDWDSSDKMRSPAWCDRILWWQKINKYSNSTNYVHQQDYKMHPTLCLSDHKPISSNFMFDIKVINKKRHKKVLEEEMRRLDKMENDKLPCATISTHMVDFGTVKYMNPVKRQISITNTGNNPCTFKFINQPNVTKFCKPWLFIRQSNGLVMPNECVNIEMEVYVTKSNAAKLNSCNEKLDDILVLHLVNGKDFFVTVQGNYVPSSFSTPLNVLCNLKKPIQQYSYEEVKDMYLMKDEMIYIQSIPKELWKLIDHLYVLAKEEKDLFLQPGLHEENQNIRNFLDSQDIGDAPIPGSHHSVAETLLLFLSSLPQSLIPLRHFDDCIGCLEGSAEEFEENLLDVFEQLPRAHRHSLEYILVFLRELPLYEANGLTPSLIAEIFSATILPLPLKYKKDSNQMKNYKKKSQLFVERCLLMK